MGTIGIPFTEEMHSMILKEARKKGVQPETLLKIWILERAKSEYERSNEEQDTTSAVSDVLALPLRVGYILTATAAATINALANEISR